jgi:hypothetical protein
LALSGALIATLHEGSCVAGDEPSTVEAPGGDSSFHALIGGQSSAPGGTYALGQQTSAMSLMFERTNVMDSVGIAIRYLNEGFLGPQNEPEPLPLWTPLHYKDAFALLATYWRTMYSTCRLGAAIGPETYFDTTARMFRSAYGNRHGLGVQADLSSQCDLTRRLAFEVTLIRSFDVASFDSTTILVGFVFTPKDGRGADMYDDDRTANNGRPEYGGRFEITAGRVDIDSFDVSHDDGTTTWISYGRGLQGSFGVEVSLLREKVASVIDRRGGALQITAEHEFCAPWLRLFAGAGPYIAYSADHANEVTSKQVNFLISYGVRIDFGARLSLVGRLGRVAAGSGRNDADLVTLGVALNTS